MAKQFTWLGDSCFPRKGPRLIKSELHNVADYPSAVLEEWEKAGFVMLEESVKSKKEKE